jgi:hypothetical protein
LSKGKKGIGGNRDRGNIDSRGVSLPLPQAIRFATRPSGQFRCAPPAPREKGPFKDLLSRFRSPSCPGGCPPALINTPPSQAPLSRLRLHGLEACSAVYYDAIALCRGQPRAGPRAPASPRAPREPDLGEGGLPPVPLPNRFAGLSPQLLFLLNSLPSGFRAEGASVPIKKIRRSPIMLPGSLGGF